MLIAMAHLATSTGRPLATASQISGTTSLCVAKISGRGGGTTLAMVDKTWKGYARGSPDDDDDDGGLGAEAVGVAEQQQKLGSYRDTPQIP